MDSETCGQLKYEIQCLLLPSYMFPFGIFLNVLRHISILPIKCQKQTTTIHYKKIIYGTFWVQVSKLKILFFN